jgi:hypothetical protein
MKKIIIASLLVSFILLISCSEDNPTTSGNIKKYPDSLGTEWEYGTIMIFEFYDSTAQIIETDTLDVSNTIVKIIKTNDSLGVYKELTLFESYDVSSPENKGKHWYSNTDSDLSAIAYSNAGSARFLVPKITNRRYLTFEELKSIINSPDQNLISAKSESISDTILFYDVPRKALAYPLAVNQHWVELETPWYRERYVERSITLNFNGRTVKCYEIKVNWPDFKIEINDYVNLNIGLLRRDIIADSVLFTDPSSPDSGRFGRYYESSNLVRTNR